MLGILGTYFSSEEEAFEFSCHSFAFEFWNPVNTRLIDSSTIFSTIDKDKLGKICQLSWKEHL